jgi:hypothetical protein
MTSRPQTRKILDVRRPLGPGVVVVALWAGCPGGAEAQLRPLDPVDWQTLDAPHESSFRIGVGAYADHAASLAGTRGRLVEVGSFRATWRSGRVTLQLSGTAVRFFEDDTAFASPVGATRGLSDERRTDVGDGRVSTILRLTEGEGDWDAALRFGVRLPTTDDRTGLERDQTDFFTTVAGRHRRGALDLAAEIGLGILGTRDVRNEQVDPVLFALSGSYDLGWLRPELMVVGQHDTRRNAARRGNEDLGEIRIGATHGGARWLRLGLVRGWRSFSPDWGVTFEAGVRH